MKKLPYLFLMVIYIVSCNPPRTLVRVEEQDISSPWVAKQLNEKTEGKPKESQLVKKDTPPLGEKNHKVIEPVTVKQTDAEAKIKSPIVKNSLQADSSKTVISQLDNHQKNSSQANSTPTKPFSSEQTTKVTVTEKSPSVKSTAQKNNPPVKTKEDGPLEEKKSKKKKKEKSKTDSSSEKKSEDKNEKINLTEEEKKEGINKLYQKYQVLLDNDKPLNSSNMQEIEEDQQNTSSLNEKINSLQKKTIIQELDGEEILYNPFGYKIKFPKGYKKELSQFNLWKINYLDNKVEFQFIIGLGKNTETTLNSLLDRLMTQYSQNTRIDWAKPSSSKAQTAKSASLESMETTAIQDLGSYYNLLAIRVLSKPMDKEGIKVFIVGILSINKKTNSFKQELELQKEIFWKIYYSFAFL